MTPIRKTKPFETQKNGGREGSKAYSGFPQIYADKRRLGMPKIAEPLTEFLFDKGRRPLCFFVSFVVKILAFLCFSLLLCFENLFVLFAPTVLPPGICHAGDEPFAIGADQVEQIRSAVVHLAVHQKLEWGPYHG
jgi:hypothetical protein